MGRERVPLALQPQVQRGGGGSHHLVLLTGTAHRQLLAHPGTGWGVLEQDTSKDCCKKGGLVTTTCSLVLAGISTTGKPNHMLQLQVISEWQGKAMARLAGEGVGTGGGQALPRDGW